MHWPVQPLEPMQLLVSPIPSDTFSMSDVLTSQTSLWMFCSSAVKHFLINGVAACSDDLTSSLEKGACKSSIEGTLCYYVNCAANMNK
jgi:hypothetical protein